VLLSPFDDLVRTAIARGVLRLLLQAEIYVPKAWRRWGYFVLPILHGDRLMDASIPASTEAGVLHVNAVFAEESARRRGAGRRRGRSASWPTGSARRVAYGTRGGFRPSGAGPDRVIPGIEAAAAPRSGWRRVRI
jgi:uncharacterized protein YcaQ